MVDITGLMHLKHEACRYMLGALMQGDDSYAKKLSGLGSCKSAIKP
jgi:hypothetical protein